ncbi:hypothetical protein B0H17DRAFT_396707 [Mycena rosella]|uniref:Uncharacterized protein n=1 Tax=Mycena rosella TaxID=1033263 RepID=A0AAD7CPV8_MYCRO|nr:hypothetical protein B0H17DRAFT_396707 [Mycena rosella]
MRWCTDEELGSARRDPDGGALRPHCGEPRRAGDRRAAGRGDGRAKTTEHQFLADDLGVPGEQRGGGSLAFRRAQGGAGAQAGEEDGERPRLMARIATRFGTSTSGEPAYWCAYVRIECGERGKCDWQIRARGCDGVNAGRRRARGRSFADGGGYEQAHECEPRRRGRAHERIRRNAGAVRGVGRCAGGAGAGGRLGAGREMRRTCGDPDVCTRSAART